MGYRLFQFPLPAEPELEELNTFLGNHRILGVHRETVTTPTGPLLIFVVQYLPSTADRSPETNRRDSVDYRQLLNESDFAVFNDLRAERARLALAANTVPYKLFSNAHFATMVRQRCSSLTEIRRIPGISDDKVKRWGDAIVTVLQRHFHPQPHAAAEVAPKAAIE